MRALVTGANGLIGASLVRALQARDITVRALVRQGSRLDALAGLDVDLVHGDLCSEAERVQQAAAGCDWVFHTALQFSYDPRRAAGMAAAATLGTTHLLQAAAGAGARRVVLTSSSVVYGYTLDGHVLDESAAPASAGHDDSPYVAAKIEQERVAARLAQSLDIDLVSVCPAVAVGPHGTALGPSNGMIVAFLSDPFRLTFPGGCNVVSTGDVAEGHLLAAEHGVRGQRYLLGAENLHWSEVHATIAELAGVPPPRLHLGHATSYLAATAEEMRARLGRRAPLTTREQALMVGRYYWYRHARAEALGYRPRRARQALAEAIAWLASSAHISREVRTRLRLHDEVYAARAASPASAFQPGLPA